MAPAAGHERTTVAVGHDGSATARQAVRWAAGYAAAAQSPLLVVHAWVWPVFTKNLGPVKGADGSGLRHSAEAILAEGIELARGAYAAAATGPPGGNPGTNDVEGVIEAGLPAQFLRDAARDARLLVVGSRGIGGVLGQLAGSVCLDLAGSPGCLAPPAARPC